MGLSDKIRKARKHVEKRRMKPERPKSRIGRGIKEAGEVKRETKKLGGSLGFTRENAGKAVDRFEKAGEGLTMMGGDFSEEESEDPFLNRGGRGKRKDEEEDPFSFF